MNGRSSHSLALLGAMAIGALGILAARAIPSAVFPELVFPRAIILADAADLPPEQMMVAVTRPLEEAAYGVVGTLLVRSTTTRGSAEIDVFFASGSDASSSFQLLNAAVAEVRNSLPAETKLDSRLLTTGTFPIVDLSLSSKVRNLTELTDIALYDVVPSFHRIPGAYRVELVGAKYREYVVRLDPAKMLAQGLTSQDVVKGINAANVIASAGRVTDSHQMVLEVVSSNLHTLDQVAAVAVGNRYGAPIHVRDIGDVELEIREDFVRAAGERGPAVLVGISRQPDGSTEVIAGQARTLVSQLGARYPDVDFSFSYDQSALVHESFNSVRDAIVLGLILAVAVVYAFTLSLASALIAMLVVPTCILGTFLMMAAFGLTFNMMTLGGLAAGIGLFIDDAIVIVETVHRERALGRSTLEAIASAVKELRRPLLASTATVMVVLAPLVLLSGVTGVFFRALATTLGVGLAISLALALYVTPALELLVEGWRRPTRPPGRVFGALRHGHLLILRPFVRFPLLALIVSAGALAGAGALCYLAGTDYLPALDEGAFVLDYITPPQSTLEDTLGLLRQIDAVLRSTAEVESFARRTGAQLGFFLTESNRGDFSVRLKPDRRRDIYQVMDSVREQVLRTVPGVHIEFSQILQDFIGDLSGAPQPVEVKVFGSDYAVIQSTARRVADELSRIQGLVDITDGIVLSNPEEEVLIDDTQAQRYRLSAEDLRAALEVVVAGTVATSMRSGDRLYDVRVRYPALFQQDLNSLSGVLVQTPDGGHVPLEVVAVRHWLGERPELERERLLPVVRATAQLSGIDLGSAMAAVKSRLGKMVLPAGVSIEYGGLYADQQRAFTELTKVMLASVAVMFLILVWEFGRTGPALAVLVGTLPCLFGSFALLALTGITLNVSSFMGIIMVVGIAAKNGILLLDRAEHEIAQSGGELGPAGAVLAAAEVRIRPILMTSLATGAGLLPLAMGFGAGASLQQPLALAVIGGLMFAVLLSHPLAGGAYLIGAPRTRRPARAQNLQQETK